MATAKNRAQINGNGANLGFETTLWAAADEMRSNMDPAEYKYIVLGLIFLKYVSDAFEERYSKLKQDTESDPEDRDEYTRIHVYWVPEQARWSYLQARSKKPEIGRIVSDAMEAIEKDNTRLRGVLPGERYTSPTLNQQMLGRLIDLVGNIPVGDKESRKNDVLGRVYEYFLGRFASAEGKGGGEFYTPPAVVRLLVAMLAPKRGRLYDPCCGSGGMFVQSEKFAHEHNPQLADLSIYGQESNPTTWKLCQMNLAIRGIEGNLGNYAADSFHDDLHKDLRADFILANPPFNISKWGGERVRDDVRWKYGVPPVGNANFAWVEHIIAHLAPNGVAGFVLANGSMSSNTSGEGEIRRNIIEADLVDCMIALPGQLFYQTQIPVCLWFIARNKHSQGKRDRRGETLFIDTRQMGYMTDRTHRNLSDEDIKRIADTYHAWRGEGGDYADQSGFSKSAAQAEIASHSYILTPGRYVGAEELAEEDEPFIDKMQRLMTTLEEQFADANELEEEIRQGLVGVSYGE